MRRGKFLVYTLKQGEISTKHLEGRIYGWCWRWCRQGFQQSVSDNPFLFPTCRILILNPDPSSVALQIVQSCVVQGHLKLGFSPDSKSRVGHLMTSDLVQPCVWPMCCTAGMRWNHFFSRTSTYIWSLGGPVMTIKPLNWLAARFITHWCNQTYICCSKTSEPCSSVVWPCLPDLEPALHWCYHCIALSFQRPQPDGHHSWRKCQTDKI